MTSREEITLIAGAIHNPGDARHFMRLKPVKRRVRVLWNGTVVAESTNAMRLLEVGKDLYDPVLYLPKEDVRAKLGGDDLTTHCPLKGDAAYFNLLNDDGTVAHAKIAWTYPAPFDFAAELTDKVAFYGDQVTIEESPLDA